MNIIELYNLLQLQRFFFLRPTVTQFRWIPIQFKSPDNGRRQWMRHENLNNTFDMFMAKQLIQNATTPRGVHRKEVIISFDGNKCGSHHISFFGRGTAECMIIILWNHSLETGERNESAWKMFAIEFSWMKLCTANPMLSTVVVSVLLPTVNVDSRKIISLSELLFTDSLAFAVIGRCLYSTKYSPSRTTFPSSFEWDVLHSTNYRFSMNGFVKHLSALLPPDGTICTSFCESSRPTEWTVPFKMREEKINEEIRILKTLLTKSIDYVPWNGSGMRISSVSVQRRKSDTHWKLGIVFGIFKMILQGIFTLAQITHSLT